MSMSNICSCLFREAIIPLHVSIKSDFLIVRIEWISTVCRYFPFSFIIGEARQILSSFHLNTPKHRFLTAKRIFSMLVSDWFKISNIEERYHGVQGTQHNATRMISKKLHIRVKELNPNFFFIKNRYIEIIKYSTPYTSKFFNFRLHSIHKIFNDSILQTNLLLPSNFLKFGKENWHRGLNSENTVDVSGFLLKSSLNRSPRLA